MIPPPPHRQPRLLCCLAILAALISICNAQQPLAVKGLNLKPDGTFSFHGLPFSVALYDANYQAVNQSTLKPSAGYPRAQPAAWTLQGEVGAGSAAGAFTLTETLDTMGDAALHAAYHVEKTDRTPFRSISLLVDLPTANAAGRAAGFDGTSVPLPRDPVKAALLYRPGVGRITLPARDGTITLEGSFTVEFQDERQWGNDVFRLRLTVADNRAEGKGGDLPLTIRHEGFRTTPLSLAAQANRGFRDEAADDRQGGWTDQGPDNDLAPLPVGALTASDVPFQIIDPARNGQRSCVVLSSDRPELPKSVTVPVPGQPVLANLYLLHAAAFVPASREPVGAVRVTYADGSTQQFDVQSQRDVGDWWSATSLANAVVGWTGRNRSSDVGLFVSRFPLNGKALAGVQFASTNPALWMVVGVTGSSDDIPLAADLPLVIHAGPDWAPYELTGRIAPGSVFDFSSLNDAPAGKHGRLVASAAGHLEFAGQPGVPTRFWGVNLTFTANFLEKEAADDLADQLARAGYNTVRFHHYDGALIRAGGRSYEFDPAQLDKLDYLFAAMKKRGVYANIDLYTIRKFSKEEIPDLGRDVNGDIKQLLPVSDAAFEAWKKFAANFLTHRNPYTGLTWGEDPALIGICPVNEDPLYITLASSSADIVKLYRDRFAQWAAAGNVSVAADADRNRAYNRFLVETQMKSDARMAAFIRSLKVPTLLTGVNCGASEALTFLRERYDYVDNHTYLDHPRFLGKSWSLPMLFRQEDPFQNHNQVLRDLMPGRVFGKPYTVTELHFCWPNRYRAAEGALTAGYASLQDWDGVYNFEYGGSAAHGFGPRSGHPFSLVNDPVELLADRAASVVFRRGDIRPAPGAVAFAVDGATAYSGGSGHPRGYPQDYTLLGLVTRIGSVTGTSPAGVAAVVGDNLAPAPGRFPVSADLRRALSQARVIPAAADGDGGNRHTSETGQIELSAKPGTLKVVADRCELFSLSPGQRLDGRLVSVENGQVFGSLYVLSADGKPLARSERVLVLWLTDSAYTGTAFRNGQGTIVENEGKPPLLVRRGAARVALRLPGDGGRPWQAWVVDADGTRHAPVTLARENDAHILSADTVADGAGCLAWELSRGR